ncbi:DENN domain-containing protein [Verticillium dahliae VdLs.17]|uniref:DENN domain-containing protein n=1 Tax=Verticillium dahliae (strain VdLs.17 / ATCC MYA-4575 / FGSC 10137) TaxID=498257 RepID=G2X1B9_VERDV|nr:DENN domain-containing protein [Verticillium dahliae VdLs.17]EGY22610.1 DENN domain-containing protein [Verticillium dahliae VdLs.17]
MAPSLHAHSSFTRPRTGDREGRPTTRDQGDNNLIIPSRTSSLHSRITQPIPSTLNVKTQQRTPKTLTHAYMVCGVGREPSQWVKAPAPAQGKIGHMKGAVGQFWLPEILGSSPRLEQDNEIARALHAAMRACFPHDVEICTGRSQPHCVHHAFVLQQDSSHTLYGISLRVWSRADDKRAETIRDLRKRTESDFYDNPDETYWIPYCLSFLSRYPLYNLLGDYLRGMWIHWNKATNLFHAEENFAIWPLFCCLSIPNIVGVIEAAISPHPPHHLCEPLPGHAADHGRRDGTNTASVSTSGAASTSAVVHARHAKELVREPGPYILGITAECRSLFTAPTDALVVDLDRNFVLTSSPPTALSPGQRNKFVTRLTQSLNGDVTPSGVPQHLRSAYGGGKLIPAGQIIVMRGEVESIQDPEWWSQDAVMSVMDHVCEKMGRNTGLKAVFGGAVKKPLMTKVSMRHLNEIVRERNQYSRDALEAWQDFINLKGRMDTELSKVTKRNNYLVEELESWKQQFLKFQAFAEQLTKETQDLKTKIENHKRENRRLGGLIDQQKDDNARLSVRLAGTEKQRDDALEALVLQQEIAEELERERKRNKKELSALQHTNMTILRQRDEARRVVLHLRSLIGGQSHHMEHLVRSLTKPEEITSELEDGFENDEDVELQQGEVPSERLSPEAENNLRSAARANKRMSSSSFIDVADRHLKDKTDAIAHIIRNIAEQCQAAVEGLSLAQDAELDERARLAAAHRRHSNLSVAASDDGHDSHSNATASELGDDSLLQPASGRTSSIPPTPDLVPNRSSTAMSFASTATTPERSSQQYMIHQDIPTKIVEDDGEDLEEGRSESDTAPQERGLVGKHASSLIHRPSGARISALGGSR